MSSVIVELQREALNKKIRVSDLLRKALVVSRKLKLSEFQEWIENELNGYSSMVPEYRMIKGQIRGWNPYHGWIPLIFEDPKYADILSERACGQSIAEIEDLLEREGKNSTLHMLYPQSIQRKLSKGFGYETEVSLFVDRTALVRVVDAVRTIILNWALKLEEEGIIGEGLSFSDNEKAVAEKSPQNINFFYGPVQNPQIQQGVSKSIQVSTSLSLDLSSIEAFIQKLKEELRTLKLGSPDKDEVEAEVATIEAQIKSSKPKNNVLKKSLSSIRRILEGAGGGVAGQLLTELGKILLG